MKKNEFFQVGTFVVVKTVNGLVAGKVKKHNKDGILLVPIDGQEYILGKVALSELPAEGFTGLSDDEAVDEDFDSNKWFPSTKNEMEIKTDDIFEITQECPGSDEILVVE